MPSTRLAGNDTKSVSDNNCEADSQDLKQKLVTQHILFCCLLNNGGTIMVYVEVSRISFECALSRNDLVMTYATCQLRVCRRTYLIHGLN